MNQTKPKGSCASTMEDLQERIAGMDVKEDDGPTFGSTVRVQKDDGTTFAQDDGPTFGGGFTIVTHLSCPHRAACPAGSAGRDRGAQ